MSDNEHTLPSLGDAEVLSVQNSVGDPIPEVCQAPEDGTHCPPVCFHASPFAFGGADRRQEARNVFADEPAGTRISQEAHDFPPQSGTCPIQARTTSRHGEVLTGPPSRDDSSFGNKSN